MAVKAYNTITLISVDDVNISTDEPDNPVINQLWLNTSKEPNELMRYDDTGWVWTQYETDEPDNPVINQLWLNTSKEPNELMRYDDTGWVWTQYETDEPDNPVINQLWLNTSKEPNELMRYNGIGWVRTQYESVEELDPEFSEWTAGLENRIKAYEDQIVLDLGLIAIQVMTDNGYQNAMELSKDELSFYSNGEKMSWFAKNQMMIENAVIVKTLQVGNHTMQKQGNEFTIFKYTGGGE